jgi:glycosyltransferase involved in cell wall biosynthesis
VDYATRSMRPGPVSAYSAAHAPVRTTISVVIVSCNEADVIEPCLQSVAGWADEIVVVDMYSSDGTRDIVRRYTDRLFDHERLPFVEPARNDAFAHARGDWILMLDPDERVPATLAHELRRIATLNMVDVVIVPRQQIMFGKVARSRGAGDGMHPRFFRRGSLSWPSTIHAMPDISHMRSQELPLERSDLWLLHDTWRSVTDVLEKFIRYVPQEVDKLHASGQHFTFRGLLRATLGQFVYRMIRGRAYEDGVAGFLAAMYFTIYAFTIQAALWESEGRPTNFDHQVIRWGRRLKNVYSVTTLRGILIPTRRTRNKK